MRFHEIRQFTVPGVNFNEAVPDTDPVTGKPNRVEKPGVVDTIKNLFGIKPDKPRGVVPLNPLNPLKTMLVTQPFHDQHKGVDLRAAVGTPVYAPQDGTVQLLKGRRAGLYIELTTASGVHKFMHLSNFSVANKAQVKAGEEIALTGNTGISTGPHLHWEYWVDGRPTDATAMLKEGALSNIAGSIWKKLSGAAEKEILTPPVGPQGTPVRVPNQPPKSPPKIGGGQGSSFYALAAKTTNAERAGLRLYDLPGTQDKIVHIGGRPIVVVDIDGFAAPFYVSTGSGGKAGVPTGKWYPFFGIGSKGWFNKGWSEEQINNYYGNRKLAQVAHQLDTTMGDIRNLVGEMEPGERALGVINAGKQPYPSHIMTNQEQRAYEKYIANLVNSI